MTNPKITKQELARAQDYWHQVMTINERLEVMRNAPRAKSENRAYHNCLKYIHQNNQPEILAHAKTVTS